MGVSFARLLFWSLLFTCLGGSAFAAPKLRLTETTVGPISIAVGQNGPAQAVEAFNAGDGALNLTVTAAADWLNAAAGAAASCTSRSGTCIPINITLNTAGLAKGIFTGVVEVADPNAYDAPQTVTVTVQMGGGVPDRADFFVAPNGSSDLRFQTNSPLVHNTTTESGGPWLSLGLDGGGSFDFVVPYRIEARHLSGMADGTYNGNINVTGSQFPPDIKNVPVTMTVTSQPIASATESLEYRLAQDSTTLDQFIVLADRGLAALSITGVEVVTDTGGAWLTAEQVPSTSNLVRVTANAAGLTPGVFTATVTVQSSAINSPHVVPVTLRVEAQGPPRASYRGVVNNATFGFEPIAQGAIAALFGDQLSYQAPREGTQLPLVTELGGARIFVNGVAAPLYFSSYGQVNFQIPYETPPGEAVVQVMRDGVVGNVVTITVVPAAARMLTLPGNYVLAVNQNGTFPVPATPARPGDTIVIYAIGFGQTNPAARTGEAATVDPLLWINPLPTVFFGGGLVRIPATPLFVGLTPNFVGLYQINVTIPANTPRGSSVPLLVGGPGYNSNQVQIAIQ